MKTITINGKNCIDEMSFYYEFYKRFTDIQSLIKQGYLTKNGKYKGTGFNPDACDDILYGGFGVLEEDEKAIVIFKNFVSAKNNLSFDYSGNKFIDIILKIFDNHSHKIELRLE